MTLTCGEDYSKLVEVVTVSHVGDEKRVDNKLVQIWWSSVIKLGFCLDFERKVSRFGQSSEARFGQDV